MIADAERIGHDRQRRIDRPLRREEACVHDIEVVHVVGTTKAIEHGSRGIVAEADGATQMTRGVYADSYGGRIGVRVWDDDRIARVAQPIAHGLYQCAMRALVIGCEGS